MPQDCTLPVKPKVATPWLPNKIAEHTVGLILLLLPGGYLTVYCNEELVPFPDLSASLGLMLGLAFLFLLIGGGLIAYAFLAPAIVSGIYFPPELADGKVRYYDIGKLQFATWYGVPITVFGTALWSSSTELTALLWFAVPVAIIATSWLLSFLLPADAVGAKQPWKLALLCAMLVGCAMVAVILYIRPLATLVRDWPALWQWIAFAASLGIHACLVYAQLKWPAAVRKRSPHRVMLALAFVLVGGMFIGMTQPRFAAPAFASFLKLLKRGGGEWVELVVDTDVARAQGLASATSAASMTKCRAQLLLDFGDKTTVRFEDQPHSTTLSRNQIHSIIRVSSARPSAVVENKHPCL